MHIHQTLNTLLIEDFQHIICTAIHDFMLWMSIITHLMGIEITSITLETAGRF